MRRRRRALLVTVAIALSALPFAGSVPNAAGADVCTNYRAVAAADGARVSYDSPGFIVIEHTDVGAPVAQVAIDSFGTATGYAAYPDPGEEVLSLLPVAMIPRDSYPLVVESQYPSSPEHRLSSPAINLLANTNAHWARAVADSGVGTPGALEAGGLVRASAAADCAESGEVTALAESTVEGLGIGAGALRIGRIYSMAKVVVGTDGKSRVESDLEISLVTLNGLPLEVTPDGVSSGAAIPLPDLGLNQLLAGLGIELTYLAAEPQADGRGVTAPALRISTTQNLSGGEPTVISLTIGRAFAAADGTAGDAVPTPAIETPDLTVDGGTSFDAPVGALPEAGPPAVPRRERGDLGPVAPVNTTGPFSAWGLYAILVAGAIVVLSSGLLFKTVGVKVGWR